jgi:putative transposase
MSNYKSKNHSKYNIKYHLIFVCKYRKKLLIKYGEEIKQIMKDISYRYDFGILEIEVDKDHIHMMIESEPKLSPLMIVRVLKQQSTQIIYGRHRNELKKQFWKENTFWTDGYFACSIRNVSREAIEKYIQEQG